MALFVHGIPGIGKTALLNAFIAVARRDGVTILHLDGARLRPTPSAFQAEVAKLLGVAPHDIAATLAARRGRTLLVVDNYQALRLLDSWLRDDFLPAMPASLRLLAAGHFRPASAWTAREPWSALCEVLELQPLAHATAVGFLLGQGFGIEQAQHVYSLVNGFPMALTIAASTLAGQVSRAVGETPSTRLLARLAEGYLDTIEERSLRPLLCELALLRRVTRPLLCALRPGRDETELLGRLAEVPFVIETGDGMAVHDAVREVLVASLYAEDPDRVRQVKRVAWSILAVGLREAGQANLWRTTADLIYLLADPVVREAFFPRSAPLHEVAPATPDDGPAIAAIARAHESAAAAALLERWWRDLPAAFRVVRDEQGGVEGFYLAFDPQALPARLLRGDPLACAWLRDLRAARMPSRQRAYFIRRWLARDDGEAPSAVQAAAWLDMKRVYLEMAPHLRRVYLTVSDLAPYAEVAERLGFVPDAALSSDIGGRGYGGAVLDMGPASVDGWLHRLLARELGIAADDFLDPERRAVMVDGVPVELTPLEFRVAAYLHANAGTAVSRERLLGDVWGHDHVGGSNVVDAVIRTLRRKLGSRAGWVRTVRGHGYTLELGG